MAWRLAEEISDVAAWKLTTIKDGFKHSPCFRRQQIETRFFLNPKQNARPETVRPHERLHENDLIDAGVEEEACKCR